MVVASAFPATNHSGTLLMSLLQRVRSKSSCSVDTSAMRIRPGLEMDQLHISITDELASTFSRDGRYNNEAMEPAKRSHLLEHICSSDGRLLRFAPAYTNPLFIDHIANSSRFETPALSKMLDR